MSIDLKKVPNTPGVYKFFSNHEIIYIGKAKDLKKRVSSYFGNSLKDRKYEIAMMRAGGATSTTVFMSVLIEGALISLIGSFIGILLGHSLMELLANYMISSYNYDFTGLMFYPFEFILILGSLLIGMISALYPAYTAYKLNIAQTLKQSWLKNY